MDVVWMNRENESRADVRVCVCVEEARRSSTNSFNITVSSSRGFLNHDDFTIIYIHS
jgi:hypothetical protein